MRARAATSAAAVAVILAGCGGGTHSSSRSTSASTPTHAQATAPRGPTIAVVLDSGGGLVARIGGDGSVGATAPDGHGGWFIAGSFAHVDGVPERGLAHITAAGAIDPRWHGALTSSGRTALAADGATLFAAGSVGDTDRSRLLAFDAVTGATVRSLPAPPGTVSALAVDGARLLVATSTSTVRARPSCLEAIEAGTGARDPTFAADIRQAPEQGCVGAIRVDGPALYLAGAFRFADGGAVVRVAKLDARTGHLDAAWRPTVAGTVYDLAPAGAGVLVAGSQPALAMLRSRDGSRDGSWRAPGRIRNPLALAALGDGVLVAGDFRGGPARLRLADGTELPSWHAARGQSAGPIAVSGSRALVAVHRG